MSVSLINDKLSIEGVFRNKFTHSPSRGEVLKLPRVFCPTNTCFLSNKVKFNSFKFNSILLESGDWSPELFQFSQVFVPCIYIV